MLNNGTIEAHDPNDKVNALKSYLEANKEDTEGDSWYYGHNPIITKHVNSFSQSEGEELEQEIENWDDVTIFNLADALLECDNKYVDGDYIYCKIFMQINLLEHGADWRQEPNLEYLEQNLLSSAWHIKSQQPITFYDQMIEKVKRLNQCLNKTNDYVINSLEELKRFQQICQQIKKTAVSPMYLELGELEHLELLYPLQQLEMHTWDYFYRKIVDWTEEERQVLAAALLIIQDNKKANFDTGALYGQLFIYSTDVSAMVMLEHFDFIDNAQPKRAIFLDDLGMRLERLEGKTKISRLFDKAYQLMDKLYGEATA